jgi:hypothetical protein
MTGKPAQAQFWASWGSFGIRKKQYKRNIEPNKRFKCED